MEKIIKIIINFIKVCCGNDINAKEKRKKLYLVGTILLCARVFFNSLIKILIWGLLTGGLFKRTLFTISFIAIIVTGVIIYLNLMKIN